MKYVLLMSLLFTVPPISPPSENTFADIQKRVTSRNEITNAILAIDNRQKFSLVIKDDEAKVTIWRHMKMKDPKMENYIFPVTADIRQEHKRLELQKELESLISKCSLAERQFRVSKHKRYKLSFNMPYEDAIKVLGDDFEESGPRALLGSCGLVSKEFIIEFRSFRLYDIQER